MSQKINKFINKKNKTKLVCLTAYSKNIAEEIDQLKDGKIIKHFYGKVPK